MFVHFGRVGKIKKESNNSESSQYGHMTKCYMSIVRDTFGHMHKNNFEMSCFKESFFPYAKKADRHVQFIELKWTFVIRIFLHMFI